MDDDNILDAATFAAEQAEAQSALIEHEEDPEATAAQIRYDAAIAAAIAATPITRPDDWAAKIARNQALDKIRGGRPRNPVAGGRQADDDPEFIEPHWGDLKYDPTPATGFAVTAKRGRLSKQERAKRQSELVAKESLAGITAKVRALQSAKPTPQRDSELGRHLAEARTAVARGEWDSWLASIPMARSESYRLMKAAKAA